MLAAKLLPQSNGETLALNRPLFPPRFFLFWWMFEANSCHKLNQTAPAQRISDMNLLDSVLIDNTC